MEEARVETFLWHELRENFINDFNFIPQNANLVETTKQIKEFIQPTENKPSTNNQETMKCNNMQKRKKPQSTRLQLENENIEGKSFRWKSNHVETTKPICTILKVEATDKHNTDRMTASDFPATFSQFKEGSWLINEAKAPEWLDAKVKTKEFNISNDDRPKMANIGDYWSEQQTTEIVKLLR